MLPIITAAACLAYAWRMDDALLEPYYAAAVRSMALDWHNFAFGAFDPDGTITLDKLPGAFWLQALSVRVFGVHVWAVVLPQVIEGALAVLVLYRAVRRLAGTAAGLAAAAALTVTPVTAALNRGNISDTLMTLLLVLAADATSGAIRDGRTRSLLLAGVWVGLAFQAKMLEAWLVLPALGLAFGIAAPGTARRRIAQVAAAGVATGIVSLSWVTWVSLTPAASRPYVDGSAANSIFEQVFAYNGFRRIGGWSPLSRFAQLGLGAGLFEAPPASWNRLLTGGWGHGIGWTLPAALIAVVTGLVARRGEPRTDPVRAALVLWGSWLVVFGIAFSATSTGWPYYAAALAPAIAALLGIGLSVALRHPATDRTTPLLVVALVVAISFGHGLWLLPREGTGLSPSLRPLIAVVGVVTEVLLVAAVISARRGARPAPARIACAAATVLLLPALASASIVVHRLGPFDTAFQPRERTAMLRRTLTRVPDLSRAERIRGGAPYLLAAQPGGLASRFIFHGGQRVLPIGGVTGTIPEPSLAKLTAKIANGEFHLVITLPTDDPRYAWIAAHCSRTGRVERTEVYYCRPGDARAASVAQ